MTGAAKINFAALLEPVARRLWGEPNPALSSNTELRWGTHGSRSANLEKCAWFDYEVNEGGGTLDLIKREKGLNGKNAVNWLVAEGLVSRPNGAARIIATYDYTNESGSLLSQVCRYDPKGFKQRRPNGNGWSWKLGDVRRVLYNLPRLLEAVSCEQVVLVVEGEKDVENLRRLNVVATCNPEGAGKWRAEFSEALRDSDVVLVPDNDEAGYAHIGMVGAALTGIARRIRVLLLPGLPHKGDASDWIAAGGTAEELWSLVDQAPDWVPPAVDANAGTAKAKAEASEQELIKLAALPPIEYDQQRKQAAKDLGVRGSTLDDEVERRRGERQVVPLFGYWAVEPWPEEVDGDALLRDIAARLQAYIVLDPRQAIAVSLWILLAWAHAEAASHSPLLLVTSAEAGSGKTTLLNLVALMVPRGLTSVDASAAALYRSIELWQPTFVIDEADTAFVKNDELRAVINSGEKPGQGVLRCIGDSHIPQFFSTFAPKAIGMKGRKLSDTTLSRCISIELKRKLRTERVKRFKMKDALVDAGLADIRSRALRWATDNAEALKAAEAIPPDDNFYNRLGDNWGDLMLPIADLAGGEWPERARETAAWIARLSPAEDASIGARLLADIRAIFTERGTDRFASAALCEALAALEDRPWVEWKAGKPLTPNGLARLLKPYGIGPDQIRTGPTTTVKGYQLAQFTEAFERNL